MQVVHCKEDTYDVYIGRGSKWGNPFSHLKNSSAKWKVSTREESIECYQKWVLTQPHLMGSLNELYGKTLGCYCKKKNNPLPCHGDVLIKLVNKQFGIKIGLDSILNGN